MAESTGVWEGEMRPEEIGTHVREVRKKRHLTQAELAALAGVSDRFVRDVERGKTSIQVGHLAPVLDVLGLQLDINPRVPDYLR